MIEVKEFAEKFKKHTKDYLDEVKAKEVRELDLAARLEARYKTFYCNLRPYLLAIAKMDESAVYGGTCVEHCPNGRSLTYQHYISKNPDKVTLELKVQQEVERSVGSEYTIHCFRNVLELKVSENGCEISEVDLSDEDLIKFLCEYFSKTKAVEDYLLQYLQGLNSINLNQDAIVKEFIKGE